MNRNRVRRTGAMMAMASFALVMLAACGAGGAEEVTEDVTRVPTMSDAAAQATRETASAPAATPGAEGGTPTTNGTTTAAVTVDVVAQDIFFEPKEVTIPADTDVTVNLPNEGAAPHNFSIDALDIDVDIAPGATEQVVINAPAGEYEFYCNVPGHKEAGMVGTLIVSEDAAAAPAGAATPAAAPAEAPPGTPVEQEVAATPAAPVAAASPANVESAASQTVDMVAYDIYFEPKEVTIPANTDVTFKIANDGVAPHNFSIDELGIDIDLPVGATEEVVVNAPAGEYEYYCNVPGHKEAGMVGTLIVSDDAAAAVPADTAASGATPAAEATELEAATPTAAATPAAVGASPAAGTTQASTTEEGGTESIEVAAGDIFFEPSELNIPADTDVTVRVPNEGVTLHNFSIDELGIDVDIAPGATEEVVINAPAGEYEYYCNVPGHKQAGMVGTLIVSEDAAAGAAPAQAAVEPATPAAAAATPAAGGEEQAAGAKASESVEVVSHDIYFEPDELSIPAGTDVTVRLPNEGAAPHNFSIDELGIDIDLAPGATEETVINAPAGEYEYYCNVPGHKEAGMVGTLTIG